MANLRITVTQKMPSFGIFSILLGACAAGAGYWSYSNQTHPLIWIGVLLFIGFSVAFSYSLSQDRIIIQVNKSGIFDRRLGVGLILWRDVTDVKLFLDGDHRYICILVKDPAKYIRRLPGVRREKALHSHSLGFTGFNVDVMAMDVNIMLLKDLIDRYVRGRGNL